MSIRLDQIKQIKESTNEIEVNEYLNKGYFLIKILSSKSIAQEIEEVRPVYVLGTKKV